jgi:hypothetical protein
MRRSETSEGAAPAAPTTRACEYCGAEATRTLRHAKTGPHPLLKLCAEHFRQLSASVERRKEAGRSGRE